MMRLITAPFDRRIQLRTCSRPRHLADLFLGQCNRGNQRPGVRLIKPFPSGTHKDFCQSEKYKRSRRRDNKAAAAESGRLLSRSFPKNTK